MAYWRFMDYHSGSRNLFDEWYKSQEIKVQAVCSWTIDEIARTKDLDRCDFFKPLTRTHIGLCEIKFRANDCTGRRQFRSLGFWNYDRREFILVSGGRKPIPESVFDDVLNIEEQFFRYGTGSLYEHL
jgi:hypothetical protein